MQSVARKYSNLIVFNQKGLPLPIDYSIDDISLPLKTRLNLPKSSVNLPNHETLHLMEKVINNGIIDAFSLKFEREIEVKVSGEGFSLFNVDIYEDFPEIIKENSVKIYGYENYVRNDLENYFGKYYRTIEDDELKKSHQINLVHIGSSEGEYEGNLQILVNGVIVLDCSLYTEVEDEDERYVQLLNNIGENVSNRHEIIFRNSDINEDLPNMMLMNEKRKELLTEIHNISPYIASVKGLLSMIKFFDYENIVEVKEYWYDQIENKIRIVPVREINKNTNDLKLDKYGLFYKINEPTDELDEDGLPILKDNFIFSDEEIMIKLFALKEYFIERDYGGVSDIVDVIGEVFNFQKLTIRTWRTTADNYVYDQIPVADYDIEKDNNFITAIINESENFFPQDVSLNDLGNVQLYEIINHTLGHFSGYFNDSLEILDTPEQKIGAKLRLKNKTFKESWNDITYPYEVENPVDITWENCFAPNYYEIRWIISRSIEDVARDGRPYTRILKGNPGQMSDVVLYIPYDGTYDVTLLCVGFDGTTTKCVRNGVFKAKLKDIDFMFFYKITDKNLQKFNTNNLSWENINQEFKEIIQNNNDLEVSGEDVPVTKLMVEYFNSLPLNIMKPRMRDYGFKWEDIGWSSFEDTYYGERKIPRFVITEFYQGQNIQVGNKSVTIPYININDFNALANFLNENIGDDYYFYHRKRFNIDLIEGVAKEEGYSGEQFVGSSENIKLLSENIFSQYNTFGQYSWSNIPQSFENSNSLIRTESKPNAFTVANTRIFNNELSCPKTVPIFICPHNSDVYGKSKVLYQIFDSSNQKVFESDKFMTVNIFDKEGYYSVRIIAEDNEGNKYDLTKQNIIHVLNDIEFGERLNY